MDDNSFKAFFDFAQKEHFVYFVLTREVGAFKPCELGFSILESVCAMNARTLPVNISINAKTKDVSLQSLRKSRTCNAVAIKHSTLVLLSEQCGLSIDYLLLTSTLFIKTIKSCKDQRKRKASRRRIVNKPTMNNFDKWIDDTQQKLLGSVTESEVKLFNKLQKTFKKRVSRQHPFVIDGKVYYADICLKSLSLIIEVDGGYHDTPQQKEKDSRRDEAFKSIGYKTIRCTNEQATDSKYVKQLVGDIMSMKNK